MNVDNLLALPLDLPKFEPDSWDTFWHIWNRDTRQYKRLLKDSAGNNSSIPHWEGFSWEWTDQHQKMFDVHCGDYSNDFPILKKKLEEHLPFTIVRILFQSNLKEIPLHQDGNPLTDHLSYATSFRTLIYDENDRETFYINHSGMKPTDRFYMQLPEGTNSFVYNNPKVRHAADYFSKRKILMHFVVKDFDEDRWFKLLESSYEKYKGISLI